MRPKPHNNHPNARKNHPHRRPEWAECTLRRPIHPLTIRRNSAPIKSRDIQFFPHITAAISPFLTPPNHLQNQARISPRFACPGSPKGTGTVQPGKMKRTRPWMSGVLLQRTDARTPPFAAVPVFPALIDSRGRTLRPPRPRIPASPHPHVPASPRPATRQGISLGTQSQQEVSQRPGEGAAQSWGETGPPGRYPDDPRGRPGPDTALCRSRRYHPRGGWHAPARRNHIAREYGRPCVAGIEDLPERFRDGDVVEVDGAAGSGAIGA